LDSFSCWDYSQSKDFWKEIVSTSRACFTIILSSYSLGSLGVVSRLARGAVWQFLPPMYMENPMSMRASSFAIASIMSDPNASPSDTATAAAMLAAGYGYPVGAAAGAGLHSSASLLHRFGAPAGPPDCRFQAHEWSPQDATGYSSGLKAMEGK